MVSGAKDPRFVESGRRGAAKRWADPARRRVVRLDTLDPSVANVIRALVAADSEAKKNADPVSETTGAGEEVPDAAGDPRAI